MTRLAIAMCGLFAFVSWSALAVELTLPSVDGKAYRLSDFRGKWVVINYWSTTCPPCVKEIGELNRFHLRHKDKDAVVIGVDFEEIPQEELKGFVTKHRISYPILLGPPDSPSPLGMVMALPTTFLLTPQGEVLGRHVGPVSEAALEKFLRSQVHPPSAKGIKEPRE